MHRSMDWIEEAKNDILAAESLGQANLYSAACFHCQQAAEKALKAHLIETKGEFPKEHSLRRLSVEAGVLDSLFDELAVLQGDYTLSRYPDTYGKTPSSIYNENSFNKKIKAARKIVKVIEEWIKK